MKSFEQYLEMVQTEGYTDEIEAIKLKNFKYYSMRDTDNTVKLEDAVKSYKPPKVTVNLNGVVPGGMVKAEGVNAEGVVDVQGGEIVNGGRFPTKEISNPVTDLSLSYFTFYNKGKQITEIVYSKEVKGKMFWYFIPKDETTMYILPGYVPKKYKQ